MKKTRHIQNTQQRKNTRVTNKGARLWDLIKRHRVLAVLVLIGTLLLIVLVIRVLLIHIGEWQFSYADSATQQMYNEVARSVAEPLARKSENACARQHRKYRDGPLFCTIGFNAIYAVQDVTAANTLQHKISDYIKAYPGKFTYKNSDGFHDFQQGNTEKDFFVRLSSEQYALSMTGMDCGASFQVYAADDITYNTYPSVRSLLPYRVTFGFTCTKDVLHQYYPRNDVIPGTE